MLLIALGPKAMIIWVRPPKDADLAYLTDDLKTLPGFGCLTDKGHTLDLELPLTAMPDLIIDFYALCDTLAKRVQTHISVPSVLIHCTLANIRRQSARCP